VKDYTSFDLNKISKNLQVIKEGTVEREKKGPGFTYSFLNGWIKFLGDDIKNLPDHNFEISFDFLTIMSGKCGLFSMESGGHDRHICLKNGSIYIRIWNTEDGDNW